MAYGLKYTIPFKDVDNYSNVVEIYQDNFVGTSTELIATDVPAVHTYEREDNEDITSSIMSATLTISFYSTDVTDFTSFFSYSDREFLVIHKFEGNVVFKGYLLNDIIGEPFQEPPYPVVLTATDGLGQLKEFQMTGPSADTDLGTLIFNQLNSLDLELDFEICNDLYEGLVMDNTKSIFDQAVGENLLIQKDTFTQIQLNAFEFLAEICKTFGWSLFQRSGRWIIQRAISRNIDTTTIYIHDWDTFEVKESYTSSAINSAKDWYLNSIITGDFLLFQSIIYQNGKFYAVANDEFIYTSVNAIDWTTITTTSQYLKDIIYADNKFVAVGSQNTGIYTTICVSTDGLTWTEYNPVVNVSLETITYGGGKFVAAGDGGPGFPENTVITSTDAINWTLSITSGVYGIRKLAYGNGIFVGVSSLMTSGVNKIFYSSNGITWNQQTFIYNNDHIIFANNKFTVGNAYSTDGINWIATPSIGQLEVRGITYGNGIFVAVGIGSNNENISISTDAISWQTISNLNDGFWNAVAYGNNKFVALGYGSDDNLMISYVNDEQILEVVADQDKAETDWIPVNSDHLLQYQRPYKKLTLVQGGLGQSIISNGENFNENSWYLEGPYKPVDWTVTPDPDSTPIQVFPNNIPSQGGYDDEQGVSWDIRFMANGDETDQPIISKPVFLDFAGLSLELEVDVNFIIASSGIGIAVKHEDSLGTTRYLQTAIVGSFNILDWSETYSTFVFYADGPNQTRKLKLTSFILPTAGFLSIELKFFGDRLDGKFVVTSAKITPIFEGVRNPSEVKKVYETARAYTSIREDNLVFSDLCITASKNWLKIGDLPAIVFVEKSLASTPNIIQVPSGAVTQVNRLTDTLGANSLSFGGGTVTGAYQRQFVSAAGFTIDSVFILVSSLSGNPPPPSAELNVAVTTISSTQRNVTITFNGYDYTGEANVQIQVFLKDSNGNSYQTSTFLFQVNANGTFTYTQTNLSFENQALLVGYSPTLRDCYARNVLSLYNALSYRLEGSFRRKGNSFGSGFTPVQLDYIPYQNGRYQVIGWEYDLASRVARITFGQVPTAYVYPIS